MIVHFAWVAVAFILGLSVTAGLVYVVRRAARRYGWVDAPDELRKIHHKPTTTAAGLAIAGGIVAGTLVLLSTRAFHPWTQVGPDALVWVGGLLLLVTGFVDDVRGLNVKIRFIIQALAAYLLLHAGYYFDIPFVEGGGFEEALYTIPVTMLWVVGITNAVNLIDGLDGLAGGITAIAFIAMATVFGLAGHDELVLFASLVVGAIGGFLLFNFNPASVFMGDCGSLFLGYMLAAFTLEHPAHSNEWVALLIPAIAVGVPVLDTALAILRRLVERTSVFNPDSNHIHHRLIRHRTERHAVLVAYAAAVWYGVAAILMAVLPTLWSIGVAGITAIATVGWLYRLEYVRGYPFSRTTRRLRVAVQWQLRSRRAGTSAGKDGGARENARRTQEQRREEDGGPASLVTAEQARGL